MNSNYPGIFTSFEGLDFCGKSTQVQLLEDTLKKYAIPCYITREPGGTPIGEKIREILLDKKNTAMSFRTEAQLFGSSRAQLINQEISPRLYRKEFVISDRFHDSSVAFQGFGREIGEEKILQYHQDFVLVDEHSGKVVLPDITFFLDVSLDELARRKELLAGTRLDRIEREKKDFYERVEKGYLWIASREPERFKVLDGEKPVESIHQEIMQYLMPALKEKYEFK